MKKTIATALLTGALSFSSAPAFATGDCKTYSPGPVECSTTADILINGYPAPAPTPNTVNGTPPASLQPTPAPTTSPQPSTKLAETGPDELMFVWGGVGLLALAAGIFSVVRVRRNA